MSANHRLSGASRSRVLIAAVALAAFAVAACSTPLSPKESDVTASSREATVHPDGGVRTDEAQLRALFPGLPQAEGVSWVTGRRGDDRVPGPSTYYLEAILTVSPETAATLAARPWPSTALISITDPDLAAGVPQGTPQWPVVLEDQLIQSAGSTRSVSLAWFTAERVLVLRSESERPFVS